MAFSRHWRSLWSAWRAKPRSLEPAAGITIAWDSNPESNIAGYIVYVGEAPNQYQQIFDVGSRTSFTFAGALAGHRYHFAVSAYADGRLEGPLSNEVNADGLA